jgi:hypothetical protein
MKTVALKDRRFAVVRLLSLAIRFEQEELDDTESEVFASVVETLISERRGVVSPGVTSIEKRIENMESPLPTLTAINLVLHALHSVEAVARRDNPRVAAALHETKERLLRMSTNSSVAPPPPPPKRGTRKRSS